ncbi:hypothetical protein D3C78_954070 [compost metagenome]
MGDARGQLAKGDQPRGVRQFVLMAAMLGFAQFAFGHVAGDADDLHHRAGVGLADGPAGGLEPQVVAVAMAQAVGLGEIAVLQQGVAAGGELLTVLRVHQLGKVAAAQFLRPVAEQGPGGRGRIDEFAVEVVPGNQVGGVLDDQPVQPPRLGGVALDVQLAGGFAAARQHPLLRRLGNEAPEELADADPARHFRDRPAMLQAAAHQLRVIARQQRGAVGDAAFGQQRAQCLVGFQHLPAGVEQQRGLRVGAEQRCDGQRVASDADQPGEQFADPAQPGAGIRGGFDQQQAVLAALQRQRQRHSLLHAGAPDAADEPAGLPAEFRHSQLRLLLQDGAQPGVEGLERIAGTGRQAAAGHWLVGLRDDAPAQVQAAAHPRLLDAQPAQGSGPRRQRGLLADQAHQGVQVLHGRLWIGLRIDIVNIPYNIGLTSICFHPLL